MKWRKQGRIYAADGSIPWAKKYGYPPTPVRLDDDTIRLYVAFCDENMVGRAGYVDVDASDPKRVIRVAQQPVLDIGQPGAFDENGVVPTTVIRVGDELYMYYVGYQLGMKVRYYQFEGLAISRDGGESFQRWSRVPVVDRTDAELLNRTSCFVIEEDGRFRMWYVAGSEWVTGHGGKALPRYNIRHLESPDGKIWPDEGRVVLDLKNDDEHALGRPWVFRDGGTYRMLFSSRTTSKQYRLAYAESPDGIEWTRLDEQVGIDVSDDGWDSQSIAYSAVYDHGDVTYLFYNGNNCGETGFGYAVLERP